MIWLDIEFISEICIGQDRISRQHMSRTIYWEYFRYNIPAGPDVFTTLYTLQTSAIFTTFRSWYCILMPFLTLSTYQTLLMSTWHWHLLETWHNSIYKIIFLINQVMYCVLDVFSSSSVLSHLFIQEMYQESWRIYFLLQCPTQNMVRVGRRVKIIWS